MPLDRGDAEADCGRAPVRRPAASPRALRSLHGLSGRLSARPRRSSGRFDVAMASRPFLALELLLLLVVLGPPRVALAETDPSTRATPASAPGLVLLLAIDQLRPDRLSPEQPGGLGRLQRTAQAVELVLRGERARHGVVAPRSFRTR